MLKKRTGLIGVMACVGLFVAAAGTAPAEDGPGITDDEILLCSYQPMTGTESSYFRQGKGADAWFKYVNDELGGIHGRKINYQMRDDQYEPARTVTTVRRFVERDGCFALVAPLGTAPTTAVREYILEQHIPLVGAGTGSEENLFVESEYVFPLYPSYHMEGQELVRFVKEVFGAKTVALLYQNDPSGQTHLDGIRSALEEHDVKLVASEGYDPRTIDVSSQVISMHSSNADVVICSCAPEPAARFYTERARLRWDAPVVNVFFGKSQVVMDLAGKEALEGVYFSTLFRDFDSSDPAMQKALKVLQTYYPEENPDAIHLWGIAPAQVVTEAFQRMGRDNITRERFIKTMETIQGWTESVVPEVNIKPGFSENKFIVSNFSYVVVRDGKFEEYIPPWM